MKVEIPDFLKHLPVQRGYPVPFFAPKVDGVWDLHLSDARKQVASLKNHLCHVCGKKINSAIRYYISGPEGLTSRLSSDTWMHEHCARYSLSACPHLFIEKADRRKNNDDERIKKPDSIDLEKPESVMLIKSDKYDILLYHGAYVINYRPIAYQQFAYENGRLDVNGHVWVEVTKSIYWRVGGAYEKVKF